VVGASVVVVVVVVGDNDTVPLIQSIDHPAWRGKRDVVLGAK